MFFVLCITNESYSLYIIHCSDPSVKCYGEKTENFSSIDPELNANSPSSGILCCIKLYSFEEYPVIKKVDELRSKDCDVLVNDFTEQMNLCLPQRRVVLITLIIIL